MKKGDEIKRIIRQKTATSQRWNGAAWPSLGSQTTTLLQAVCAHGNSGSGNGEKVTKKRRKGKKGKKKGSGVRQFVEIVRARKPFISELGIVNIKNRVSSLVFTMITASLDSWAKPCYTETLKINKQKVKEEYYMVWDRTLS